MNHHAEAGRSVSKDKAVKLMLKHALWLAEDAKQYVDSKSWKEFAKTRVLYVDEDVEMDEPERGRLVRPISSSPLTLDFLPKQKRVGPGAQSQTYYLLNTPPHSYCHRALILGPHLNTPQMINSLGVNPNRHPARNVHRLHPSPAHMLQHVCPCRSVLHLEFRTTSTGGARSRGAIITSIC